MLDESGKAHDLFISVDRVSVGIFAREGVFATPILVIFTALVILYVNVLIVAEGVDCVLINLILKYCQITVTSRNLKY